MSRDTVSNGSFLAFASSRSLNINIRCGEFSMLSSASSDTSIFVEKAHDWM